MMKLDKHTQLKLGRSHQLRSATDPSGVEHTGANPVGSMGFHRQYAIEQGKSFQPPVVYELITRA